MSLLREIWKYEKRLLLTLAAALAVNAASIPLTAYYNSKIDSGQKTVVLSYGYADPLPGKALVSHLTDFFMYTPITLRQNLRGNNVDWYSKPSREQVVAALQDPQYQNIILIGHGTNSTYEATDGDVTVDDLVDIKLPSRTGEFIQHTCGSDAEMSLREMLYPNGSKGYGFNGKVGIYRNYGKALAELVREYYKK